MRRLMKVGPRVRISHSPPLFGDNMNFLDFQQKRNINIPVYIATGISVVSYAQIFHLNETDYNRHVILDEFYKDLPELMDVFAESWLANTDNKVYKELPKLNTDSPEEMIQVFVEFTNNIYPTVDSALKSALDDIMLLCKQTLYKLRKLTKLK